MLWFNYFRSKTDKTKQQSIWWHFNNGVYTIQNQQRKINQCEWIQEDSLVRTLCIMHYLPSGTVLETVPSVLSMEPCRPRQSGLTFETSNGRYCFHGHDPRGRLLQCTPGTWVVPFRSFQSFDLNRWWPTGMAPWSAVLVLSPLAEGRKRKLRLFFWPSVEIWQLTVLYHWTKSGNWFLYVRDYLLVFEGR